MVKTTDIFRVAISGKVKTVTIKRDSLGDIYVYFVTDAKELEVETRTGKRVGFDFGLKKFLKASDGKDIESQLFFARNSKLIANACRNLSRKVKGSNNSRKSRLNLARLYKKTYNQRHDFHFKLARLLCLKYETICIEDLNLKGMQRLYGRKISDLAFSEFVAILKYEATKFGVKIVEVDRYFASSQICNCCGYKNSEVKDLKVRRWTCPHCGIEHDRDLNAAINILKNGLGHRPLQETK
jgi:putative transposase